MRKSGVLSQASSLEFQPVQNTARSKTGVLLRARRFSGPFALGQQLAAFERGRWSLAAGGSHFVTGRTSFSPWQRAKSKARTNELNSRACSGSVVHEPTSRT